MSITPSEVLDLLKDRYSSYKNGTSKPREIPRPCGPTQSPIAAILTCIDSRVSVDDIFDNSDNSLMIARVAGNITSPEISASLEYAVAVAGCKVIVVLGHTHCGAVASAIANADITENIITLLSHIDTKGSTDAEAVTISNIEDTCRALKSNTLLSEIIAKGELEIVGALYDVESCELTFF